MTHPWNELISALPDPHLLQTYEWGRVKTMNGWEPLYAIWDAEGGFHVEKEPGHSASVAAAALILKKTILQRGFAAKLSLLYAPKGPLLDWSHPVLRERVLDDLQAYTRRQGAIFLKIDPDVVLGTGVPGMEGATTEENGRLLQEELAKRGWQESADQIQFRNTVLIDLSPSEDELLRGMKQKTRYNVRLAEKKGVTIRTGVAEDLPLLYKMYAETSVRDGFVIRDEAYYRTVWSTFMSADSPHCEPLIAEFNGEPLAAIFLFTFAGKAYYIYGMSREAHREKMPAYLLQWEAIQRAKAAGCAQYDLWGAPDDFSGEDRMSGVYRFKEGLGDEFVRTLGAWDYAPNRLWYRMYGEVIPRLLDIMRSRGRQRTKQDLD